MLHIADIVLICTLAVASTSAAFFVSSTAMFLLSPRGHHRVVSTVEVSSDLDSLLGNGHSDAETLSIANLLSWCRSSQNKGCLLIIFTTLCTFFGLSVLHRFFGADALVVGHHALMLTPALWELQPWTMVTSLFTHESAWQMIRSIAPLLYFDRLERHLGTWAFVGVFLAVGTMTNLCRALWWSTSYVSFCGASCVIAGLIVIHYSLLGCLPWDQELGTREPQGHADTQFLSLISKAWTYSVTMDILQVVGALWGPTKNPQSNMTYLENVMGASVALIAVVFTGGLSKLGHHVSRLWQQSPARADTFQQDPHLKVDRVPKGSSSHKHSSYFTRIFQ